MISQSPAETSLAMLVIGGLLPAAAAVLGGLGSVEDNQRAVGYISSPSWMGNLIIVVPLVAFQFALLLREFRSSCPSAWESWSKRQASGYVALLIFCVAISFLFAVNEGWRYSWSMLSSGTVDRQLSLPWAVAPLLEQNVGMVTTVIVTIVCFLVQGVVFSFAFYVVLTTVSLLRHGKDLEPHADDRGKLHWHVVIVLELLIVALILIRVQDDYFRSSANTLRGFLVERLVFGIVDHPLHTSFQSQVATETLIEIGIIAFLSFMLLRDARPYAARALVGISAIGLAVPFPQLALPLCAIAAANTYVLWKRLPRVPELVRVPENVVGAKVDSIPAEESKKMSKEGEKAGCAVVIGVAKYQNQHFDLPESVTKDAEAIGGALETSHSPYRDVAVLTNMKATRAAIVNALDALKTTPSTEPVIVFFSGHGARKQTAAGTRYFLVPHDFDSAKPESGIDSKDLADLLNAIPSQRKLLILDACHSGGFAPKELNDVEISKGWSSKAYQTMTEGSGSVLFASSSDNEVSLCVADLPNSLFTHYMLDALRGNARMRDDGVLRVFDLFDHVAERVPSHSSAKDQQHPVFKTFDLKSNFGILSVGSAAASTPKATVSISKSQIRTKLVEGFSLEEFKSLVVDLGELLKAEGGNEKLSYDLLEGEGFKGKARELLEWCEREKVLHHVVAHLRRIGRW